VGAYVRAADGTLIGHVDDSLKVAISAFTAEDVDIRALAKDDDSVTAWQGGDWTVYIAAGQSIEVTAQDLEIRDLVATQDSVGAWLRDGSGSDINSTNHALDVNLKSADISLDVEEEANTAIESGAKAVSTTGALLTTQLDARKYLFVQNLGNQAVYIGKSGVTTSNGLKLSPDVVAELRLGPALSLHAVAANGTQDVRLMQLA
jgi:hypothetical protein